MPKIGHIKSYAHASLLYGRAKRHPELGLKLDSPDRRMQRWGDTFRISIHGEIVAILHPDNTMEFIEPDHYNASFGSNFSKVFPLDVRNIGRQRFNVLPLSEVGRSYAARGGKKAGVLLVDHLKFDMLTWKPINPPVAEGRPVNKAAEARFRKALTAYTRLWKVTARLGRITAEVDGVRDICFMQRDFSTILTTEWSPTDPATTLHSIIVGQKIDATSILQVVALADHGFVWHIKGPMLRRPDAVRAMSISERHGLIFSQVYTRHRDDVRIAAGVFDRG